MKPLILFLLTVLSPLPPPSPALTTFNGVIEDLTQTPVANGTISFDLKPGVDTTVSGGARFTPTTVVCQIANPAIVSTTSVIIGGGPNYTVTVNVAVPQTWQAGDSLIFVGTADATLNATTVLAPITISAVNSATSFNFIAIGSHVNGMLGSAGGIYSSTGTGPCQVTQNSQINPAYTSYSVAIQPAGTTTSTFNTYAIGLGPVDITTIVPTPSQQPSYSFVDLFSNGQTIIGLKNFTNPANTYAGGIFNSPTINNGTFNTATATNWLLLTPTIQHPTFSVGPIVLGGNANTYQLNWAAPSVNRSLTIPDPGGSDTFAFVNANQTLANKNLGLGTSFTAIPVFVNGYATEGGVGLSTTVASVQLVTQSNGIGATDLFGYNQTGGQAFLAVHYSIITHTASGTGTADAEIQWTDCDTGIVQTLVSATIDLSMAPGTAAAEVDGTWSICPRSGTTVNYLAGYSNGGSGALYDLRYWVEIQ